eukprot:CAMPEP_0182477900 /NCGR_PEP_ID=MMETSP1319-20130603/31636_1 /TAXON_ID=172717 /ORGANISM="Bolidomonas pacifica, Strain RCC208" /LENGTH=53 /DNA_ID=CAMNT_0024679185 /DNA_START=387 /DNA_END=548 /DNA_ORIENTATION=-
MGEAEDGTNRTIGRTKDGRAEEGKGVEQAEENDERRMIPEKRKRVGKSFPREE